MHLIGLVDTVTNRDDVVDHLIDGQRGSLTHNLENTRKRYSYQSDPTFGLDGLRLACAQVQRRPFYAWSRCVRTRSRALLQRRRHWLGPPHGYKQRLSSGSLAATTCLPDLRGHSSSRRNATPEKSRRTPALTNGSWRWARRASPPLNCATPFAVARPPRRHLCHPFCAPAGSLPG